MLVALRQTAGEVATPVPVTVEVCGLPEALSVTCTVADFAPAVVGRKATGMMQFAPAAKGELQAFGSRTN